MIFNQAEQGELAERGGEPAVATSPRRARNR